MIKKDDIIAYAPEVYIMTKMDGISFKPIKFEELKAGNIFVAYTSNKDTVKGFFNDTIFIAKSYPFKDEYGNLVIRIYNFE